MWALNTAEYGRWNAGRTFFYQTYNARRPCLSNGFRTCVEQSAVIRQEWAVAMGGAAGTAGTAVAVPLLREVRQNNILPYHITVKKSQTYR